MTVNIEKMRFDMAENQRLANLQQRWETRKFVIQVVVGAAALIGAGTALGNYISRTAPVVPQVVQQFPPQFPPGTVITIPPAPAAR